MADPSHVSELQEALHNLLNSREQNEFVGILSTYHSRNNIHDLVHGLRLMLDTPAKLHLARLLRKSIPKRDLRFYDELMGGGYVSMSLPRKMASHKNGLQSRSTGNLYRPGSTMSVPATSSKQHFGTLPSRKTAQGLQRQKSVPQDLNRVPANGAAAAMWDVGLAPRSKRIQMNQPEDPNESLGFSIRGGAEHGIGIYVSYVDPESLAERQGLVPGDQILSVNGIPFMKIFHDDAAKIVRNSKQLSLEVRNVGRVPGSFETHQTYTWVDPIGRTVSPPPEVDRIGRYENSGERKSGLMLLKDSDERKVHVVLSDNRALGLMIRGGNEFGLGIYITSIDVGSVAENAGIKVGDQILDVNGQSFLDIAHYDAVSVIKSSQRMMMTVKEVGKLPFARTTFDHTKWVPHQTLPRKPAPPKEPSVNGNGTFGRSTNVETLKKLKSVFMRGAGSQLMLSSMSNKQTQWGMVEEKGRSLLNDAEQSTLNYYLSEYQQGTIQTEGLVLALNELLNTQAKFSLISEVRGMIIPRDLDKFDELILQREVDSVRSPSALAPPDQVSNHSLDSLSNYSAGSGLFQDSPDGLDPLLAAIEQINGNTNGSPELYLEEANLPPIEPRSAFKPIHPSATTASVTSAPTPHVVVAEVHHPPVHTTSEKSFKSEDMRSPSEDSGVDLNGVGNGDFTDHHLHRSVNQAKVTVSTQKPVIINDLIPDKAVSQSSASPTVVQLKPTNHDFHRMGQNSLSRPPASQLRVERREGSSGFRSRDPSPGRPDTRSSHGSRDKSPGRGSLPRQARMVVPPGYPKDRVSVITLHKLRPTLGIAIEGGANTRQPLPRIINIQPGGSAHESGGLKLGHTILEVNGKSMLGLEHREAAKTIAEAFKNKSKNHMDLTVADST